MKNTKSNVVLVTGGAGYIGSHVCKLLAQAGYLPVAYDNLICGHSDFVKWGPLVVGDISDKDQLRNIFLQYKPEAVMHFAAHAYVGESVNRPEKYYRNNVCGTLALLEVMAELKVMKMIFSSTCATYGLPQSLIINEETHQNPINPYGASKLMVERMLKDFYIAHGLSSVSLRYFNAGGADFDCEIGEWHVPETHLIPIIFEVALKKRDRLVIYGNDYETPDGTCIRDYIHVIDLASAHVKSLIKLDEINGAHFYNLGNGNGHSVLDVLGTVERHIGRKIDYEFGPKRMGDPPILIADATSARAELDWVPSNSDLNTIIKSAWKWQQKIL
jgi:UDP-arabinose 4-epimerase